MAPSQREQISKQCYVACLKYSTPTAMMLPIILVMYLLNAIYDRHESEYTKVRTQHLSIITTNRQLLFPMMHSIVACINLSVNISRSV